jgi:hypothetical protein
MKTVDIRELWRRRKHGSISEREIVEVELVMVSNSLPDRHLAILIVGLSRKPTPARIRVMKDFLTNGRTDEERYCALRVLCRYWQLWRDFLAYLFEKTSAVALDHDPAVSDEAFSLLGEYLSKHSDRNAWLHLITLYDAAMASGASQLAKTAGLSRARANAGIAH